ncbi:MAG TPA: hypothetical protein VGG38_05185 [Acidimicrobiales bacterium]|jgi:hypothetical protein
MTDATAATDPEAAVPASEPSEVGQDIENAAPGDELSTATDEGSISAGEGSRAADADVPAASSFKAEVIIGEIPDTHDLAKMLWTARCSDREHDLLGHFDTQEEAVAAKDEHLAGQH